MPASTSTPGASQIDLDALVAKVDLDDVVARLDLDSVVSRVDPEAIVKRVDIDAVIARVDVEAVLARLDLAGIAHQVIEAIDLPEILRESTGSVASEAVRGVRADAVQADEAVARFMDRLLRRSRVGKQGQQCASLRANQCHSACALS